MSRLDTIQEFAKRHAAARETLAERVRALNDEVEDAKRRKLPGIKLALSAAKDSQIELVNLIATSKEEFVSPRSRVFHGLKLGIQKARGGLKFEDAAKVCTLIKKHFAEQSDVLIKTTETPIKTALQTLPASDLKRLGISISVAGDVAFVKPIDSDIDKLVKALLESDDEEDDE